MSWLIAILASLVFFGVLWIAGRIDLVASLRRNEESAKTVAEFSDWFVRYADSDGQDRIAYRELLKRSTTVEWALGYDNIGNAVKAGLYVLNGVPILPLALHEMQRLIGNGLHRRDAVDTAETIHSMLVRHLGRREAKSKKLYEAANRADKCIGRGWNLLAAIPLAILKSFGLLSERVTDRAKSSWLFRLWSFLLALLLAIATIASPILSYFADRPQIETSLRDFLGR